MEQPRPAEDRNDPTAEHLVLRPKLSVKIVTAAPWACLLLVAIVAVALSTPPDLETWLTSAGAALLSLAFGLYYVTSEVHATPTGLWHRRYWRTVWSIPMSRAGTTEGSGEDQRLIHVFDLITSKRIGAFNWYVLDPAERIRLAEFVDRQREALGVKF